ncbi:MAG: DUF2961 domain-containing protein [Myxococcales bacterium]|nr:DUF2961 domain-containing protein [Myxococcales bacterium]
MVRPLPAAIVLALAAGASACGGDAEPAVCPPGLASCALGYGELLGATRLAEDRADLVEAALVSSSDRGGGNLDLGLGAPGNSILYVDAEGRNVVFDEAGPGLLTRIWLTHPSVLAAFEAGASSVAVLEGDLQFRFDDEPAPRISLPAADFFAGAVAPFVAPFVADPDSSAGGYVSYVPLAFERRLVVSTSALVPYLQVGHYRVAGPVSSFDPAAVPPELVAAAEDAWRAGPTPPAGALVEELVAPLAVPPLGTDAASLADGPGVVWGLELAFAAALEFRPGVRLRVVVDGATAIDAPLGDFFTTPLAQVTTASELLGVDAATHRYTSRFPMPYASSLSVEVADEAGLARDVTVTLRHAARPVDGLLRLHAAYREQALAPADPDFRLADVAGRGHLAGTSLALCCRGAADACHYLQPGGWGFLEGDEKIYVDGAGAPTLHGTGTEDYFNSGYYYLDGRAYSLPSHGMPYWNAGASGPGGEPLPAGAYECATQYRLHVSDPIPFRSGLVLDLEHGPESDMPTWYRGVVYYYLAP